MLFVAFDDVALEIAQRQHLTRNSTNCMPLRSYVHQSLKPSESFRGTWPGIQHRGNQDLATKETQTLVKN